MKISSVITTTVIASIHVHFFLFPFSRATPYITTIIAGLVVIIVNHID